MTGDRGQRPDPNAIPCADCGHVWFAGERRHHYVDADGASTIGDEAEAVCALCRRKREHGTRPADDEDVVSWW